jgi:amidophosphoribosyltransferase
VAPGEMVKISKAGIEFEQFANERTHAHCAFEFTYFSHPSSIIEGVNVYESRKRVGKLLAKKFPIREADLVVPVPDSARPAALAYATELGLSYEEGLLKDRYRKKGSMRSFIEPHHKDRIEINKGIVPIDELIKDKHVIVIDDSIVRGTSSSSIVKILRASGAKKISMIITYPPVRFPCYAGIDFPSQEELIAYQQTNKDSSNLQTGARISKLIGADEVFYNDTSNLSVAIGIPEQELCFSCSVGDYSPLGITPIFKSRAETKGED